MILFLYLFFLRKRCHKNVKPTYFRSMGQSTECTVISGYFPNAGASFPHLFSWSASLQGEILSELFEDHVGIIVDCSNGMFN